MLLNVLYPDWHTFFYAIFPPGDESAGLCSKVPENRATDLHLESAATFFLSRSAVI